MVSFAAPVWLWNPEKGSWHFVTVPEDASSQIRLEAIAHGLGNNFGSVRVLARIGSTEWRPSVFRDSNSGCYLLPLKAEVRRAASMVAGDQVSVELDLT